MPEARLRQWVLATKRLLETGPPKLGVALWLQNLGAFFEGVEESACCRWCSG